MQNKINAEITVKSVNLRYLYDIAAIPKKTREEYLLEISKRLNSYKQKNVRLLKIIYEFLEEDRKILWNDDFVCRELSMSKNMLYSYKSILLRGLREHFFNWKAIEKEKFGNADDNDMQTLVEKAELMEKIGMRKEAKHVYLKIEKEFNKKGNKLNNKNIILFRTIRSLSRFYYINKNWEKFNYYYKKTEKLGRKIIKEAPKFTSYINLMLYTIRVVKMGFFGDKTSHVSEAIKIEKRALVEARNLKEPEEEINVLDNLTHLHNFTDTQKGLRYAYKGLKIAKKCNRDDLNICFRVNILRMNFELGRISRKNVINEINKLLNQFNTINFPSIKWKQLFLVYMIRLASMVKEQDEILYFCLYKYTESEIICKGLMLSLRALYFMKWEKILDEIKHISIEFDESALKSYLTVKKNRNEFMLKFDNTIIELSLSKKNLRQIVFRTEFLTAMLLADFWKGNRCSYEFSKHIMKQLEYIAKTRPEFKKGDNNKKITEFAYFGILLMSDSRFMDNELFLKKYELKFKQIADSLTQNVKYIPINDYYMLSFMAEQSGYNELKEIAKKTFWKIERKYPKLMQEEIEKIKERDKVDASVKLSQSIKAA